MPTVERRDTDEMLGHIRHHETQRKLWFVLTLLGFILTTVAAFRSGGPGRGADLVFSLALNAGVAIASIVFYRVRVKEGDRIGFVLPTMLGLLSTLLAWVITRQ
jgi:hypothetical protein